MAAPWEKDPIIQPTAAPWDKDPIVQPAAAAQPPAAPPAPVATPAPAPPEGVGSWLLRMLDPSFLAETPPVFQGASDPVESLARGTEDVLFKGLPHLAAAPADLLGGLMNLPVATADYASRKAGGPGIDFRFEAGLGDKFADWMRQGADALGVPSVDRSEDTTGQRMSSKAIDFATQALGGSTGLALTAAKQTPAMVERARKGVSAFSDEILQPYAQNSGRVTAGDVFGGGGSGVGVSAAEEYYPDSPWANLGGAIAGGVGGSMVPSVATAPARAGSALLDSLPDPSGYGSKRALDHAARFVKTQAIDPADAASRTRERVAAARENGEPVPTTGLASDDVGMVALERGRRVKDEIPFINRDREIAAVSSDNVASFQDPGADQKAVGRRAGEVREERVAPARADQAAAETAVADVTQARQQEGAGFAVRRGSDRQAEASRNLDRAVVDETYLPARAQKNAMFDEEGAGTDVDMAGVANRARAVRAEVEALPESIRQRVVNPALLDDLENIETLPFEAASQLRMQLSEDIAAARKAGQFGLADNLNAIRRDLSGAIDQNAPEAAANYRTEFAPRFRPGPGDEAAKFTKAVDRDNTRSMTPPEKTASRFLSSGEKTTALTRMLADQPSRQAGEQAARDYLLSDYASSVLNNDGTVNAIRAAKWAETNADVLAQFPQLRNEVDGFVNTARQGTQAEEAATARLREARDRLKMTERDVDASAAGTLLRAENGDPKNVARRIFGGRAYGSENQLNEINDLIGTDESARRGWKAAVAEVLSDEVRTSNTAIGGKDGPVSVAKMKAMFDRHEKALAVVFGPEGMNKLRRSHKMLEHFGNLSQKATLGSPTAANQQLADYLEAAILTYSGNAITTGMVMKRLKTLLKLAPEGVKNMTTESKMNKLIDRMWFDPELYDLLLTREVKEINGPRWSATLNRILGATEFSREQWGEDE